MSAQVFQILVTALLGIIIGLSTWLIKAVLDLRGATAKVSQQLWGVDGKNGHASDIRGVKKALEDIGDMLLDHDYRLRRIEERQGMETPPRARPRFRSRKEPEDPEEDSRD